MSSSHTVGRYFPEMARDTSSWETLRLDTERLSLRPWTLQDVDALYVLFADPEVMSGLHRATITSDEETRAIIEGGIRDWARDGVGPFVIETAVGEQQVLGQAGVMIFDTRGWLPSSWSAAGSFAQPELGWALVRAHWGHGYATEAAAAILEWACRSRSLDQLVSLISPDNARSQRVARRLGAVPAEIIAPAGSNGTRVVWRYPSA